MSRFILAVLWAVLVAVPTHAQKAAIYVSSVAGDRLQQKRDIYFRRSSGDNAVTIVTIDHRSRDQTVIGFGASFLEAGMICINSLDRAQQERVFRNLFDPETGAGFSAMKTVIGSTDFMSAGPWFSYDDHPGDAELTHFSIERDLGPNGLITYIKRAQKYGRFVLEAPMDYPPDWMLYDLETRQDVDPRYYDVLAHYYLRYVQEYAKHGVVIDYLSLFNEPYIGYTKISYEKIRELLKNHVGPLFERSGVATKLQMSEDPRRVTARKLYPVVLDDPAARRYLSTIPYHGYDFSRFKERPNPDDGYDFSEFKNIAELHKLYPDMQLWMTEACFWNEGTPWARPLPRFGFEDGDFWGRQIMADIKAGASGWIYWNMILDQTGGPELVSPVHRDPPDNKQQPLVIINREKKTVTYTGAFYYLAHFSRFVRPGSVRIAAASSDSKSIDSVAFLRPDGHIVVQLINSSKRLAKVRIQSDGKSAVAPLAPVSITTVLWKP